jgi:uncharacterized protein (DUF4213/DUF364 family)
MYSKILASLSGAQVRKIRIGINWTAVVVEQDGQLHCGLASTLAEEHDHKGEPDIPAPGHLEDLNALALAGWINSEIPLRRSLGCAAINALLPQSPDSWIDQNAETAILEHGKSKITTLVGHFPFVDKLRDQLGDFNVLDLNPIGNDLPASAAPEIIPQSDLVAITGMAFINQTLPRILELCRKDAYVLILGPSTPLSPVLGEYGVNLMAGAIVENIPAVLAALEQGGTFRQLHKAGVRLVTQIGSN